MKGEGNSACANHLDRLLEEHFGRQRPSRLDGEDEMIAADGRAGGRWLCAGTLLVECTSDLPADTACVLIGRYVGPVGASEVSATHRTLPIFTFSSQFGYGRHRLHIRHGRGLCAAACST